MSVKFFVRALLVIIIVQAIALGANYLFLNTRALKLEQRMERIPDSGGEKFIW